MILQHLNSLHDEVRELSEAVLWNSTNLHKLDDAADRDLQVVIIVRRELLEHKLNHGLVLLQQILVNLGWQR